MLGAILGLIPGLFSTVNGITKAISDERITAIKAKTDVERIQAEERAEALKAKRDVLVASSAYPFDTIVRSLMAVSVLAIDLKLLLWDKVIGSLSGCGGDFGQLPGCEVFRTDPLSTEQWAFIAAVHGFYFLYMAVRR